MSVNGEIPETLVDRVCARVGGAQPLEDGSGVILPASRLEESMQLLRDDPALSLRLLVDLTASDRLPHEPRFRVRYDLCEPTSGSRLRVDVDVLATDPNLPTVSGIWPSATWLEREVYDLFGVGFDGHPDRRRLLLDEDFVGHPLRKDFRAAPSRDARRAS